MGFLQPLALLGLGLAAIPPILHLFGRRLPPIVVFPAVRYLVATEREHSRRLRLRNLLLMLLRTAVLVLLVLAVARPVVQTATGGGHAPAAVGLVLDNSLSTAAIVGGEARVTQLAVQARAIVERLTPDDVLWIVTATGEPRAMAKATALDLIDTLAPEARRLDIGAAVHLLSTTLRQAPQELREIVVLSDGQATAFTSGTDDPEIPVLVLTPAPAQRNRGIDSASIARGAGPEERIITVSVGGEGDRVAALLMLGDRSLARTVVEPGATGVLEASLTTGWYVLEAVLDPDELRADDRRWIAVHIGPPTAVDVGLGAGQFVRDAADVLAAAGRVRLGPALRFDDRLARGASVLFPPVDRSMLGAVNRALAARGVGWQFEERHDGEWLAEGVFPGLGGATVRRRHVLTGGGDVFGSVGGDPWLVRGGDVVLIGSRMDPDWTDLPLRAGFIPFMDAVANRLVGGGGWVVHARPGGWVVLPEGGREVIIGPNRVLVSGDRRLRAPSRPGVYFVAGASGDTVGAVEVNHDSRESSLLPADAAVIRAALGPAARILTAGELQRDLFAGARRADLTTAFLVAALLAAVAELLVSSVGSRVREP